jgi:uncharacterized RDD family membrane protein YckC
VPDSLQTPLLRRRLICMLYEAMLLFGIVFVSGFLFDVITQSKHALVLRHARQAWLFFVIGFYFVFCWSRGGQTLAMQTWKIRVVDMDGSRLPVVKAIVRYCLAWMWFIPAMAIDYEFGLKEWDMLIVVSIGLIGWAMTSHLDPQGQFLHDKLAKTRLIHVDADNKAT